VLLRGLLREWNTAGASSVFVSVRKGAPGPGVPGAPAGRTSPCGPWPVGFALDLLEQPRKGFQAVGRGRWNLRGLGP